MPNEPLTDVTHPKAWVRAIAIIALIVAIAGLFLPVSRGRLPAAGSTEASTLRQVTATQTLRVGYEGYPPYTMKDPSTGKLSGFSVELAEYLAREAGVTFHRSSSLVHTSGTDAQAGRLHVLQLPEHVARLHGGQQCPGKAEHEIRPFT